jgi:hypothetical protein
MRMRGLDRASTEEDSPTPVQWPEPARPRELTTDSAIGELASTLFSGLSVATADPKVLHGFRRLTNAVLAVDLTSQD